MFESLLVLACFYGTETSCRTSGQAYYKQSKLEHYVETFQEDFKDNNEMAYKALTLTAILGYGYTEKRARGLISSNLGYELNFKQKQESANIFVQKEF